MLFAVDNYQRFKSFISQATFIRLEYSSSNAEKSFGSNFKFADYFFKQGYDVFSCVMTFETSVSRAGLRGGGNGGNWPEPPALRGPPVMKFIWFK